MELVLIVAVGIHLPFDRLEMQVTPGCARPKVRRHRHFLIDLHRIHNIKRSSVYIVILLDFEDILFKNICTQVMVDRLLGQYEVEAQENIRQTRAPLEFLEHYLHEFG